MFNENLESLHGQDIVVLGPYRPWSYHKEHGGDGGSYPEHSGRILDVKSGQARGIDYFFDYMIKKVSPDVIAVVPSHDPAKVASGISTLASRLAQARGCHDGSACLVRHTKINKLSAGGDRSVQVHLNSIHVVDPASIAGKSILLIDDVMTTGNSLLASRILLMGAGAGNVRCLALGRTTY